jgi:glycosyltransferase involved in cell wall biosynthesis
MKISIIIPVYNEEKHIADVFTYIMSAPSKIEREFIVIDDCSSDNSVTILKDLQKKYNFILNVLPVNGGKGAAVIRGIKESTGDFIMVQDADFEYDPWDLDNLTAPLLENKADVVFGSRFKKNGLQIHRTYHYLVNRFLTTLSNLFSDAYLTDMETCYKVFRSDLIKSMNLESPRFGIEVELTAYTAKTSARIFEIPVNYYPRTKLQGKKINWKDGIAAIFHIIKFNLFRSLDQSFTSLPERYNPNRSKFDLFKETKGF